MSNLERIEAAVVTVPDFPKKGIQFKDITPILTDPELLRLSADLMTEPLNNLGATKICGIESRGFLFGSLIAERLNIGLIPIRKAGKLPRATFAESYELEYGAASIEIHADDLGPEDLVIIHDDVLATGGTAEAAAKLVEKTGARVCAFSFIMELSFLKGSERLNKTDCFYLLSY